MTVLLHIMLFTFHYVSIKSDTGTDIETVAQKFTFHYVSIKSITTPMPTW